MSAPDIGTPAAGHGRLHDPARRPTGGLSQASGASARPTDAPNGDATTHVFVLDLLRPYWGWLAIVLVAIALETLAGLAAPWPLKIVIDSVAGAHDLPHSLAWLRALPLGSSPAGLAAAAAVGVVLIALIGAIAGYVDNYYTESIGQWVANDLRIRVYHHLERLSLGYYDTHQTGALLSTLTDDVLTIQDFASSTTLTILIDLLTISGILGLMFWLNWDFAMIAAGVTPFVLFFVTRFRRAVKRATHEVRRRQSDIVAVAQQALESMRVVEAFGREDLEEARLAEASRRTVEAALKARRLKSLVSPLVAVTVSFCTAFVVWRSAGLIIAGSMTVGALTVFLAYLAKFFKPVQELAKMTSTVAQAAVALDRIRAILDTDTMLPEKPGARDAGTVRGDIVFDHVSFAYRPGTPVLRDVSFAATRGQRLAITGPTGCGKSTVASLIARFYDIDEGRVTIDGIDVRDCTLQWLRSQIGFVLQDSVLFRGTVRENIAYGRPGATDAQIVEASRLANAHEFIAAMPKGYDTLVGERGAMLSGGQRQRIGIARALVRNAPILILDEPTASLDSRSEQLVMEALERLMVGRTVVLITHRLATVRTADKIIVLNRGELAEEGTHETLLAAGGIYAGLYRLQSTDAPATHDSSQTGVDAPAASRQQS